FSARLRNLILENIILLNVNDLFSIANLSCPLNTLHKRISQAQRQVTDIHAIVFSPLNILFPALKLL
ncbi:MAG: hypothetical protein ACLQO7_00410, partial [Candidatus Bathyarchaeia archaeon]